MSKKPFISVKDLSVGYSSRSGTTIEVLRNVGLDINHTIFHDNKLKLLDLLEYYLQAQLYNLLQFFCNDF